MKFDFDNYKGKCVMHCKTEEEAKDFCRVMNNSGRTWCTGELYTELTHWGGYRTDICYSFNMGQKCDINWYKKIGYTILEWGDFMKKEFTKADLKCGCDYCNSEQINNTVAYIPSDTQNQDGLEIIFKYCPMCGRKLVGE